VTGSASADRAIETPYSWLRLGISILISAIGGVGMWSVVVAFPAVQAEFGAARGGASLSYTAVMLGFAAGGVVMGRLMDKRGIVPPLLLGAVSLGLGYTLAGLAPNLFVFAAAHGVLIGALGSSASFGPLLSDLSLFFSKRRGLAVSLCASGNYLAGAVWPRVVQHGIDTVGWRYTHIGIGLFCIMTLVPLALLLRRRPPEQNSIAQNAAVKRAGASLRLSPGVLQLLLFVAGIGCCVAMAMPQVHLVAYCGDLGYGAARGAEMLSMMLGLGIISRIASGFVADRFGGLFALGLGSLMQGLALTLFLFFDSLASLYAIAALFGLFQGGIVPSYAIIVREYFDAKEAGTRVGVVLMATLLGMAFGGWLSGAIFDWTGSYAMAFFNGVAFNLVNLAIIGFLLVRGGGPLTVFRVRSAVVA
jgi:MFS family permease